MNNQDTFSGNNTTTIFKLTGSPINPQDVLATVNGYTNTYGHDFCIQSDYILFVQAPPFGNNNIMVNYDT